MGKGDQVCPPNQQTGLVSIPVPTTCRPRNHWAEGRVPNQETGAAAEDFSPAAAASLPRVEAELQWGRRSRGRHAALRRAHVRGRGRVQDPLSRPLT